jgi:plasmid stabilization system protein ParE
MAFKIIFKSLAYNDIDEAVEWYESNSKGLGKRFLHEIELLLLRISASPFNYRVYHKTVRRILFNKFPYKIYYVVHQDTIVVLGIYHGKRSKAFVNRRLK